MRQHYVWRNNDLKNHKNVKKESGNEITFTSENKTVWLKWIANVENQRQMTLKDTIDIHRILGKNTYQKTEKSDCNF